MYTLLLIAQTNLYLWIVGIFVGLFVKTEFPIIGTYIATTALMLFFVSAVATMLIATMVHLWSSCVSSHS